MSDFESHLRTQMSIADVTHLLRPISHRYRILGVMLGVECEDLQYSHSSNEDKLTELCQRWKRDRPQDFTYAELLEVTSSCIIQNRLLNRCIRECVKEAWETNRSIQNIPHPYYSHF